MRKLLSLLLVLALCLVTSAAAEECISVYKKVTGFFPVTFWRLSKILCCAEKK